MTRFLLPLGAFVVVCAFLWKGLSLDPREIPSPLINKPAPTFTLSNLHEPDAIFDSADMAGKVWLLNVWASWCVACRQEHPLLVEMARSNDVAIYGLNYKDKPDAARGWLRRWGDPYVLSVRDNDGRVGIDFGVYGVPETFVIDATGTIRYKQIGPVTATAIADVILPLVHQLEAEAAGTSAPEDAGDGAVDEMTSAGTFMETAG